MSRCFFFKKITVFLLAISLLAGLTACGTKKAEYETYELKPARVIDGSSNSSPRPGQIDPDDTTQYTVEDIQAMNNGNARIFYNSEGYVTFINGRYSDMKVNDHEDAIVTLRKIAVLIGIGKGSEFFADHGTREPNGYTYYTFKQRYGSSTVMYSSIIVVVDPQGYTAGLSCCIAENIGIAEQREDIGEAAAIQALKNFFSAELIDSLTFIHEATQKVAYNYYGNVYDCYVLYAKNPSSGANEPNYIQIFITTDGTANLAVSYVDSFGTNNLDVTRADDYFTGLTTQNISFNVTLYDGKRETITVPVSYRESTGLYYLIDPSRKIAVGLHTAIDRHMNVPDFLTSKTGTDWRNRDLITYARYIMVYDYYAERGLRSVDGCGIPIYIGTQWDEDNAVYENIHAGWACFGASDLNNYLEAIDVVGHEYTHGVCGSCMGSHIYSGITGAIHESYSDIMGNIIEMSLGMTDDTEWLLSEKSGRTLRSMKNPELYQCASRVGGPYYVDPTDMSQDNGGNHINSSILNHISYLLNEHGMTLDEQSSLWITSMNLKNPVAEWAEILETLILSIDINGFDAKYKQYLIDDFRAANMI